MKKIIIVFVILTLILSINSITLAVNNKFYDVQEEHWAYNDIVKLVEKGTLSGYTDGTFKPNDSITRAEAAKILMTTFRNSMVFPHANTANDVPISHWANPYITNGRLYITLDENKNFRPDEYITREDFTFAVHKMIQYHLPKSFNITKQFSDVDMNNKNYDAIISLASNGIINGFEDNTFRPDEKLTRAQVCKIINVAYEYVLNKYVSEMKEAGGWATYQIESYDIKKIREDNEGNLMVFTGGKSRPVGLYYNGEYVTTADKNLTKIRKVAVNTPDGKKWSIKWYGTEVVELIEDNNKWIIKDNYSGISRTYEEEYIAFEELIVEMRTFTGLEYEIIERDDTYSLLSQNNGVGLIDYIEKNGKRYGNVSYIEQTLWNLYVNSSKWNGVTKEVLENSKVENEDSITTLVIPDIPIESFASEAKQHNTTIAFKNQVGIVHKMVGMGIENGEMKTITKPVYLRLREMYAGNDAEEIIKQYNKDAIVKYNKRKEDNKLYCLLFDVDLRDFSNSENEESPYTSAYLMFLPYIKVTDLKNGQIGQTTGESIVRETDKNLYYKGELTQIYIVFETPSYVEVSAVDLSFVNENDYTYENFFISTINN